VRGGVREVEAGETRGEREAARSRVVLVGLHPGEGTARLLWAEPLLGATLVCVDSVLRRAGRRVTRWVRTALTRLRARLTRPGRPALGWTLRLTLAAVASYAVAEAAFPGSAPLTAPLTALLVVQLTPVSLLVSGLDRVVSVVAGVGVAVLLSSAFGLTWWTLGLLVGVSLVVGQVLRLGENLLEVPISAMLVLGVGAAGAGAAAGERIAQTLVGAGIGVLSNLLVPPRIVAPNAAEAIEGLAGDLARLLDEAGEELASDQAEGEWLAERAGDWLGRARLVTHGMPTVGAALLRAEESRRLNVRAFGTPDAGPGLRQGLEALEHCSVAVRSLFGNIDVAARSEAERGGRIDPELRVAFGTVLGEMADGLRTFGRLVREEAAARPLETPDAEPLRASLTDLHEARARLVDLLLAVDPRADLAAGELVVSLVQAVERLLRELDLDERGRRRPQPVARPRRPLPRVGSIPRVGPVRRR
jgi:hypothetical protein